MIRSRSGLAGLTWRLLDSRVVGLRSALADERSGRVVFLAHCLLDQNTRYLGGAFGPGAVDEVVDTYRRDGAGICQLPCPERIAWGGVLKPWLLALYGRPSLRPAIQALLPLLLLYTRLRYRLLARRVAAEITDYARSGVEVVGIVGVGASPSCGVATTLDIGRALDALVGCPLARLDRRVMNGAVAAAARPGPGMFTTAIAGEVGRRGLAVPLLEHDLRAEWPASERAASVPGAGARRVGSVRPASTLPRPSRAIASATRRVLERHLPAAAISSVIREATAHRAALATRIPAGLNRGGRHLLDLGCFAIGVHAALVGSGVPAEAATAWVADAVEEANRPALDWLHRAGVVRHRRPMDRLRWESRLLCRFYYAAPAWDVEMVTVANGHGLDIRRCAIAEFYRQLGLGSLCDQTICVQDERVARRYGGPAGITFHRSGTLAGGADRCDFRYLPADAANAAGPAGE